MVFDVNPQQLEGLNSNVLTTTANKTSAFNEHLMQVQHDYSLMRYIDLCKHLNLDLFWPESFSLCILVMCRSTHNVEMVNLFVSRHVAEVNAARASDIKQLLDVQNLSHCEKIISSISDFYNLFTFVDIDMQHPLICNLEHNGVVESMMMALRESKISTDKAENLKLSLYVLLFMSPRTIASGSILERLLLKFDLNKGDVELKCLRAMTLFRDALHDEKIYMNMLVTLCATLKIADSFHRSLKILLDKRQNTNQTQSKTKMCRLMLRTLAHQIHRETQSKQAVHCFKSWKSGINFPISMGLDLQRLLYFICAQNVTCSRNVYEHLFARDVIHKALENTLHIYDAPTIVATLQKIRLSMNNVKHLIDFRQRCLIGIDSKTKQNLTLPNILQLYIACYQHDSIMTECWQSILPGHINHITQQALHQFRETFVYEVDHVVENLVRCLG